MTRRPGSSIILSTSSSAVWLSIPISGSHPRKLCVTPSSPTGCSPPHAIERCARMPVVLCFPTVLRRHSHVLVSCYAPGRGWVSGEEGGWVGRGCMLMRLGIDAPRRGCWGLGSQMLCSIASYVSGGGIRWLAGGDLQDVHIVQMNYTIVTPPADDDGDRNEDPPRALELCLLPSHDYAGWDSPVGFDVNVSCT